MGKGAAAKGFFQKSLPNVLLGFHHLDIVFDCPAGSYHFDFQGIRCGVVMPQKQYGGMGKGTVRTWFASSPSSRAIIIFTKRTAAWNCNL